MNEYKSYGMESLENKTLDNLNTERVATTRDRVARAIRLVADDVDMLVENTFPRNARHHFAHAINLLDAAVEEMRYACDHFKWNDSVCDLLDSAIAKFGYVLSDLIFLERDRVDDDHDYITEYTASDGMTMLGKALASLERWFDDSQDVSEV